MTKYNDREDDGDNDIKKDTNDNENVASRSGSDGFIFNLITTPRLRLVREEGDWDTMATAMQMWNTMYIHIGL